MSTSIEERFHERAIINIIRGEHDRIGVSNGDRGRYGRRGEKDGGDDHHNWEVVNAESGDEEPYGSDQTEATMSDRDNGEVFKISVGGDGGGPDDDHDTVDKEADIYKQG